MVNATGVWVDELRQQDGQALGRPVRPMVAPSQGVHIVVDREFLPSDHALLVPKTADGRVLFAVPWLGKLILGTTDSPRQDLAREPLAFKEEVDFILNESAKYLPPRRRSRGRSQHLGGSSPAGQARRTTRAATPKAISREHTVLASASGLVTRHRWQMDHLPRHGRGRAEKMLRRGPAARAGGRRHPAAAPGRGAPGAAAPAHVRCAGGCTPMASTRLPCCSCLARTSGWPKA
ncbi:glycerol-3-phosphate dehydrogenase [Alicycliphilus sp. B1]|nr:glycerol-3-phosphate dehydrogenase [Alicycliphilus sp. B1]